jgi:uncharacterized protein DUF2842
MAIRTRKLIGAIALLALILVWSLGAMAFAQFALTSANQLVAALYYATAGLGWLPPAMLLVSWMSRPDRASGP